MQFHIRELRKAQKISQQKLSSLSGVSRTTISGLESGTLRVTSTDTLEKLAIALNRSIGDLVSIK